MSRPEGAMRGIDHRSIENQREADVQLQEMSWPAVAAASKDTPVVVPIAAVEQHGRHLPVFTDSMLLGEVTRRASEPLGDRVIWAPLLWLGNSHHHIDFPGTLSAAPRTYLDVLGDLIDNLVTHGFRRIVLLNGHGGNIVPGQQAVFEARQRHRHRGDLLLLSATYWLLGSKPDALEPSRNALAQPREGEPPGEPHANPARTEPRPPGATQIPFVQTEMGHACEWETSMILHLAPQLVGELTAIDPVPQTASFAPASRGWITRERSEPGHIGDPRNATAAKGEMLFRTFSRDVVSFLERVIDWDGRSWEG